MKNVAKMSNGNQKLNGDRLESDCNISREIEKIRWLGGEFLSFEQNVLSLLENCLFSLWVSGKAEFSKNLSKKVLIGNYAVEVEQVIFESF